MERWHVSSKELALHLHISRPRGKQFDNRRLVFIYDRARTWHFITLV